MAGRILGWMCVGSALLFGVIWEVLLFSRYVPPADPGQRFWLLVALCSQLGLTLLCGPPLLILNPFR